MNGPSKARFQTIFDEGVRASGSLVSVCLTHGSGKVAVTTQKLIGCHARRNRQKRRTRAAIDLSLLPKTVDLIVIGKVAAQTATFTDLQSQVNQLIQECLSRLTEK